MFPEPRACHLLSFKLVPNCNLSIPVSLNVPPCAGRPAHVAEYLEALCFTKWVLTSAHSIKILVACENFPFHKPMQVSSDNRPHSSVDLCYVFD